MLQFFFFYLIWMNSRRNTFWKKKVIFFRIQFRVSTKFQQRKIKFKFLSKPPVSRKFATHLSSHTWIINYNQSMGWCFVNCHALKFFFSKCSRLFSLWMCPLLHCKRDAVRSSYDITWFITIQSSHSRRLKHISKNHALRLKIWLSWSAEARKLYAISNWRASRKCEKLCDNTKNCDRQTSKY